MLYSIIIYVIAQQSIKLKAFEYFQQQKIRCNFNELIFKSSEYKFYGGTYNEMSNLIKVNNEIKLFSENNNWFFLFSGKKNNINDYLKDKYEVVCKKKYKKNICSTIIYEYNSIIINNKLNIIASVYGKKCNEFNKKKIFEWFLKKQINIFFKKKLNKKIIKDYMINSLRKNNLNICRKDINVYFSSGIWNIEIYGIKKRLNDKGKLLDNLITYNLSKVPSLNSDCNLEKIVLYPERDR